MGGISGGRRWAGRCCRAFAGSSRASSLEELSEQSSAVGLYTAEINAFADYMEHERGLTPATIRCRCWFVPRFLDRLDGIDGSLREITPDQIDDEKPKKSWCEDKGLMKFLKSL